MAWLSFVSPNAASLACKLPLVFHHCLLWALRPPGNLQLLGVLYKSACARYYRLLCMLKNILSTYAVVSCVNNLYLPRQGASAVLVYGMPQAPLAQPRALFGGHFLSALVGICVTKLFSLIPSASKFESLRWLAASLSTAIAIVVMQVTDTTHPPAGATALLPAVDIDVWNLSWYFLPIVLLSSAMILAVALLLNNIQRVYPIFWITPATPTKHQQKPPGPPQSPPFP